MLPLRPPDPPPHVPLDDRLEGERFRDMRMIEHYRAILSRLKCECGSHEEIAAPHSHWCPRSEHSLSSFERQIHESLKDLERKHGLR